MSRLRSLILWNQFLRSRFYRSHRCLLSFSYLFVRQEPWAVSRQTSARDDSDTGWLWWGHEWVHSSIHQKCTAAPGGGTRLGRCGWAYRCQKHSEGDTHVAVKGSLRYLIYVIFLDFCSQMNTGTFIFMEKPHVAVKDFHCSNFLVLIYFFYSLMKIYEA